MVLVVADAREKLERWHRDYNEVSPHGAIGNKPPITQLKGIGTTGQLGTSLCAEHTIGLRSTQ